MRKAYITQISKDGSILFQVQSVHELLANC
jgi:hypothetical protein